MDSILTSIKKLLGIDEFYTHFDEDIILHINTAFMILHQLGVGPSEGFYISDKTTKWFEFFGAKKNFEAIKTYVYLKVRIIFDPPQVGYLVDALNAQITEYEWRINAQAEGEIING